MEIYIWNYAFLILSGFKSVLKVQICLPENVARLTWPIISYYFWKHSLCAASKIMWHNLFKVFSWMWHKSIINKKKRLQLDDELELDFSRLCMSDSFSLCLKVQFAPLRNRRYHLSYDYYNLRRNYSELIDLISLIFKKKKNLRSVWNFYCFRETLTGKGKRRKCIFVVFVVDKKIVLCVKMCHVTERTKQMNIDRPLNVDNLYQHWVFYFAW